MLIDNKNHNYLEVGNIRVTYVPAIDRSEDANWSGSDVLRIQAYKNEDDKSLHLGAELPIESPERFIELISTLCSVYNAGQNSKL